MKVPYLNRLVDAEFDQYMDELSSHVSSCVDDANGRRGAKRLYTVLYPLFMFIRQLSAVDFEVDPSRNLILDQMRIVGDKDGFVAALSSKPFSGKMRKALADAIKELTFTPYLNELWSDALLCLNSFVVFNYRSSHIALRCMLEDLYRHLYYKDHPEEYGALRFDPVAEDSFKMAPAGFRDYLSKVTYLRVFCDLDASFERKQCGEVADIFSLNNELYALCSGYVHGAKLGSMNSFRSNSNALRSDSREAALVAAVSRFVKMSCAFLIAAHSDEFRAFSEYDKSVVFGAFTAAERHGFRRAMNV